MNYYSIITDYGKALETAAISQGRAVILTDYVIGDGNGQAVTPDPARTTLVREVYRGKISSLDVSQEQATQLIARLVLPPKVGGFVVREAGLLTKDGHLYAVASCAAIEKPEQGVSVNLNFRLAVSEKAEITLSVISGEGLFLRQDANLSDLRDTVKARGYLGLKGAAVLNVGEKKDTVAAGDDRRLNNALQKGNNLSELTNTDKARRNLGLGSLAAQNADNVHITGGEITTTKGVTVGGNLITEGSDFIRKKGISADKNRNLNITRGLSLQGKGDQYAEMSFTEKVGQYADISFRVHSGGLDGLFSLRNNGELRLNGELWLGDTCLSKDGNIHGTCWQGWLYDYLNNTFGKRNIAHFVLPQWWRCGSTGLIIQWGTAGRGNNLRVNFPVAFPSACFTVMMTQTNSDSGNNSTSNISVTGRDNYGFTSHIYTLERSADWVAFGH